MDWSEFGSMVGGREVERLRLRGVFLSLLLGRKMKDEHLLDLYVNFKTSQAILSKMDFDALKNASYWITEKSVGCKCYLLSLKDNLYLIDKQINFYSLSFRLPTKEDPKLSQHETLLEGQMVYNHKFTRYVFMICNVLSVNGKSLDTTLFSRKLTIIRNEIIVPLRVVYPEEDKQVPFPLLGKDFFKLEKLDWFKKKIHQFTDEEGDRFIYENGKRHNDSTGIVFVPEEPLLSPSETFKKWKWPQLNSILFHVKLDPDLGLKISLWENNAHIEYPSVYFDFDSTRRMHEDAENFKDEGIIIECYYNPHDGEWNYLRIRPDQTQATTILSAMRRLEISSEGIDFDYLQNEILNGKKKPTQEHIS